MEEYGVTALTLVVPIVEFTGVEDLIALVSLLSVK